MGPDFPRLIINADDYGRSSEVNDAIRLGVSSGVVTSTTVMANMSNRSEVKHLALDFPSASIGLHVNLTEGYPLLPPERVGSLLDSDGSFMGYSRFVKRLWMGAINRREVEEEVRAQFEEMERMGVRITHFDSHQHIHVFPQVLFVILKVAKAKGVLRVRTNRRYFITYSSGRVPLWLLPFWHFSRFPTAVPGAVLKLVQGLLARKYGFRSPDYLLTPIPNIPSYPVDLAVRKWSKILPMMPPKLLEVNCHPGLFRGEKELFSSAELKRLIEQNDVKVVSYHDV